MTAWQIIVLVFLTLLPMALLLDFWPDRDRLTWRGAPIERRWQRQIDHPSPDDEAH